MVQISNFESIIERPNSKQNKQISIPNISKREKMSKEMEVTVFEKLLRKILPKSMFYKQEIPSYHTLKILKDSCKKDENV